MLEHKSLIKTLKWIQVLLLTLLSHFSEYFYFSIFYIVIFYMCMYVYVCICMYEYMCYVIVILPEISILD